MATASNLTHVGPATSSDPRGDGCADDDRLRTLPRRLGTGWNRFWFTPSDPLALSAMRVLVGLLATYTLLTYTPDLERFFAAGGLIPVPTLQQWRGNSAAVSYLELFSSPRELWIVHILSILVVAALTVGFCTRTTSILTLVVMLSYFHRGPMLTSQMEPVMAMVLAYLCVGPAGAYLSVDRWLALRKAAGRPAELARLAPTVTPSWSATVAVRLVQVHLALVYAMMGLAKLNDGVTANNETGLYNAWWRGEAVWWLATKHDSALFDLSGLLANHPRVVNVWTHAIVAFELGFAILIWRRGARPLLLWAAVPMWLSLAAITGLTPFCAMMLIANLAFVPPGTVRRWVSRCCYCFPSAVE